MKTSQAVRLAVVAATLTTAPVLGGMAWADGNGNQTDQFHQVGKGTTTAASSTPGCQFTGSCTESIAGTVNGTPIHQGTYNGTLTIDYGEATSNGQGGFCAPAAGPVTLTDSQDPGNSITKQETGQVCEVGATGPNVPHSFSGTWAITGGTGEYSGATGSGTVRASEASDGTTTTHEDGTFTYPAETGEHGH
jgi:hypothetical protein